MRLTFLGTGTSMGVPTAGGFGSERLMGDSKNERWRCSAWIETGESSVIIDTGPEFRLQTIRAGVERVDAVFLTHEHMDHIAGLDDLRPFNYKQDRPIPVYGNSSCLASIRNRFDYMFGPARYPGAASLELNVMDEPIRFQDLDVAPLPIEHGSVPVTGFRMNDLSYLTDVKAIPDETRERIRGSKVLVLSGLRWEPEHPTHLTIPEAAAIAAELEVPMTYLIHMNSYVIHEEVNARLPDNVRLAYDQLTVEL